MMEKMMSTNATMRKLLLVAGTGLMLAGCVVAVPLDAPTTPMNVIAARKTLHNLANPKGHFYVTDDAMQGYGYGSPVLRHDGLRFGPIDIPYDQMGAMSIRYMQASPMINLRITLNSPGHPHTVSIDQQSNFPYVDEHQLASALIVLKQAARSYPDESARLEKAIADYRATDPKPAPSESMRRFQIQAEEAVRSQHFMQAAEIYTTALNEVPAWPQGHFNFALVLESLGDYELAIEEMQHYLALEPDAPNARAAQDGIYRWQARLQGVSASPAR